MIKTVKFGKKEVRLDNNVGWTLIYRDQFGRDIIPALMPLLAGALDVISGFVRDIGVKKEVELTDIAELADGDALVNAMIHIGGFEFTDFINITWALAKNADDSIPEPKEWVRDLDEFPVDTIAPEVVKLVFKGMVSSKNLRKLNESLRSVQLKASPLTKSSSQEPKED